MQLQEYSYCVLLVASLMQSVVYGDTATTMLDRWNVMVVVELSKQGKSTSSCPSHVISDLENEFRDWIQDEFEVIQGDDSFAIPNVVATEHDNARRTDIQAIVRGVIRKDEHTASSIAKPLQWTVQTIIDQWRSDVSSTRLDPSCMGETTRANLVVYELPHIPQSWKNTPIILGFQTMPNATRTGESQTVISAY